MSSEQHAAVVATSRAGRVTDPVGGAQVEAGASRGWWTGYRVMALGMLVLQLTWVFAVPPFRGSDEFDHVYRAAAAARGQWFVTPSDATRGTGAWLEVPRDIVDAARPQCADLPYTHAEDCYGSPHGDSVRIASGAGRYHPLFYAIVGTAALPFDGHAAVYAMRLMTVLLCWLLFCLALGATRSWARTPWPAVAIALASTPVLIYSCAVVAPNGVEMMAGMALLAALLGLLRDPNRSQPALAAAAAIAGTVLVTTRSLGPLWCLLVLVTVLIATRPTAAELRTLLLRRSSVVAAGVVGVAAILSVAWIVGMDATNVGQKLAQPMTTEHRLHLLTRNEPMWTLQSIAAFPLRDEPSRMPVYACYLALFAALFVLGIRAATASQRVAVLLALVVTSAVPFVLGLDPESFPGAWQGRYGLPYSLGIALLLGFALDSARRRLTDVLRVAGLILFVTAQVIGPVDVYRMGQHHQLRDYATFPHPPVALLVATAAVGAVLLWWGAVRTPVIEMDNTRRSRR